VASPQLRNAEVVDGLPPGPRLPSLAQIAWFIRDRIGMLERCGRDYGEAFTIRFPWETLVVVWNPEVVRQVFTGDPHVLHAGKGNAILKPFLGDRSVLLLDGAEHLRQRRLLLPPFHGERMLAYGELMRDVTLDAMSRWPEGTPFPVQPRMQEITLTVILRAVFGIEEPRRFAELKTKLTRLLDEGSRSIATFLPFLQVELAGLTPYGRFRRRLREIDDLIYREIAEHRPGADGAARTDVLSLLLQARDEDGNALTPRELRDELLTLLVAGHETSATSLAWTFYYVLKDARVVSEIRAELDRVVGDGPVRPEAVGELRYLDAVLRETARLRPILTFVARQLQAPIELAGYRLPAGVTVAPCIQLVQRRADLYPDPEAFRPERFLERKFSPYEYFPFGGGDRRCLGMAFAQYEMKVVLATVLSKLDLRLPADSNVRPMRRAITIAPSDGTRVVVDRRHAP
jgi:cytochrome P450